MKISIQLTISRTSNDVIKIVLKDPTACIQFLQLEMSPHDFAMAITGMGAVEVEANIHDLEKVGKKRIMESRTKLCSDLTIQYEKAKLEDWLKANAQEEGWGLNAYLGSQTSISHTENGAKLHYTVSRWEDVK